jgi:hypothetical protein
MDIIVLILIVFLALSVVIVSRVIIYRHKRLYWSKKEEKAQKEKEKLTGNAVEYSPKQLEPEAKTKEEIDNDKALKGDEFVAINSEDEAKKDAEENNRLATALKLEIEEKLKAEAKAAAERLRKEREEESLGKEEERLKKINAEEEEQIDQEAREKVSKEKAERERLEAEEKVSKEVQDAKARKAEKEKARKEEAKEKEDLESRLKGEERPELPPGKRGGRPRGLTKQLSPVPSQEPKPRSLKPEIICWNEGWKWIVGIDVPEEFESPRVTQNDELLEQDYSDELRYLLRHIEGIVKVAWAEGEQDREIDIPSMEEGRNYLIFKMRRAWKGLGRLVRRPTAGYYLIITPQKWERNEETSGIAPVAPENVQINGYKAHFFVLKQNDDTAIEFIDAKGKLIQVESARPCFQLVGKEISDSPDDMGPLFGEESPHIKTIDEREWSNVGVVVIGEEGSGKNRWRTEFIPQEGDKEQMMPDELTNRQGGWYFVRIYDNDDDLLDSMDFRFLSGLKEIRIMNSECLPGPTGYNDVTVQFVHQVNCKVEPADAEMHRALTVWQENDLTIGTILPKPDYDKTHWILRDGEAETKVTVLVERIWWYVGSSAEVPANWTDKTVSLSRKDFTAITDKALWMKFPRKRWISQIDVGFNRTKSRNYNVEIEKEEIAIPLRDFCDAEEIENKEKAFAMKIWFSPEVTQTYETIVLQLPTELSPPVIQELPPVEAESLPVISPPKLYAKPKSCQGKRENKGFSRNEIDDAELTMEDVKRLHIAYDKRRKSSHSWKIERLKSITNR